MTITVQPHQSLFDLAVQHYGDITGVFDLVQRNGLNSVLQPIPPNTTLNVPQTPRNLKVQRFLQHHTPATMTSDRPTGIGWMTIQDNFSVK